jgi:antitoxin (DNA-binding transcriptional repressor) of toxin-antitoxin stability system
MFRLRCGWYMERARDGESFLITRRGRPHARLLPPPAFQPQLEAGANGSAEPPGHAGLESPG